MQDSSRYRRDGPSEVLKIPPIGVLLRRLSQFPSLLDAKVLIHLCRQESTYRLPIRKGVFSTVLLIPTISIHQREDLQTVDHP